MAPITRAHATVGRGKGGDYVWFDPQRTAAHAWGRHLPHWRQPGTIYFVTFRTADSIPTEVLTQWRRDRDAWLDTHPEPHDEPTTREYHERFTERMHRFLDAGHGECPFREPSARACLIEMLTFRDGTDYRLDGWVVMPNHVHALVCPGDGAELSEITKTWKRVSSHRLNKMTGKNGRLWQHESWDHIVRSADHLEQFRRYIEANPRRLPAVHAAQP